MLHFEERGLESEEGMRGRTNGWECDKIEANLFCFWKECKSRITKVLRARRVEMFSFTLFTLFPAVCICYISDPKLHMLVLVFLLVRPDVPPAAERGTGS